MIRLACRHVARDIFSLFILGKNGVNNSRAAHLDTGVYLCDKIRIVLKDDIERYDFSRGEDMVGVFKSCADGKYTLDMSSDMTLNEVESGVVPRYFIEVICEGHRQMSEVKLVG